MPYFFASFLAPSSSRFPSQRAYCREQFREGGWIILKADGLLIIGIDSGSLDLILKFRGSLPNISRLMAGGVYGYLESTIPPLTPPAWTAILTGKNPGKTGIFNWATLHSDIKKVRILSFHDLKEPTVWDVLTAKGLKSCVVNVPMTYPAKSLNGILISGVPGHISDRNISYPKDVKKELDEAVGGYEILPLVDLRIQNKEEEYSEEFKRILRKRLEAILYLLNKDNWDLFMCVFFVLDSVQHYFWHHMDESYPLRNKQRSKKFKNTILDFYKLIDSAIGAIIRENGGVTKLIVCSDHGMGPLYSHFMINNLLVREKLLVLKQSSTAFSLRSTARQVFIERALRVRNIQPEVFDRIAKVLPATLLDSLSTREQERLLGDRLIRNINWDRTLVYAVGEMGPVFIHEAVDREEAFFKVVKALDSALDEKTRRTLKVYRKEDVYHGKYTHLAPDLVILISDNRFNVKTEVTERRQLWKSTGWTGATGHHSMNGVIIANSPEIVRSTDRLEKKGRFSIYQVMPTALTLLRLPTPTDLDGKPLAGLDTT